MTLPHETSDAATSVTKTVPPEVLDSSFRNLRRILVGFTVGFTAVMSLAAGTDADVGWMSAMVGGLCVGLPSVLVAFAFVAAHRHEQSLRVPTVELHDGELTVRYGKRILNAKIDDCRLWRGRASRMRLPLCPRLCCYRQVILINLPPTSLFKTTLLMYGSRVRVAVGYTDEMLCRWEQALQRTGDRTQSSDD